MARPSKLIRVDNRGRELQIARAVARRLGSGDILVIGRDADEVREVAEIVTRALALGVLPAVILALLAGVWLSIRAQRRIEAMNRQVQRIIAGELRERLPAGSADPLGRLAGIVNMMLDELERLVGELANVGDDIAHDLRTPLTRVRAALERSRDSAQTLQALRGAADQAIAGLDQCLTIITALLRIAEIDHGRRVAAMGDVRLSEIVRAVQDLYGPVAEDKGVSLTAGADEAAIVTGDRDLLFEAVANLVDNAIKFTPGGGSVRVDVMHRQKGPVVRVKDTGPGIGGADRQAVFKRFYRPDKSRHAPGVGLGLSLVAAIARLHGFRVAIGDGPGCTVELICCSGCR
jgi:signal transduction histidine kinase